jgi:peptide/nickel transport system permease protein
MAPLPVALALVVANAILIESALSFLGCGIPPPTPTWGNMLTNAQSYVRIAPWLAVFPGLLITLCVGSVVFVGDALRDAFDPRLAE